MGICPYLIGHPLGDVTCVNIPFGSSMANIKTDSLL